MTASAPLPAPSPSTQTLREHVQHELANVNTARLTFLIFVADLGMLLFGYEVGASCWLVYAIQLLAAEDDDNGSGYYYKYVSNNATMLGLVAALVSLGALIGYITLLVYGDRIPKNWEIMGAAIIYVIGAVLQSISDILSWSNATGFTMLLLGRFIYGLGIAMSLHAIPQYIAEVTPKETRGSFGATVEATLMCGMTLGYLIGYLTDSTGWFYTFMGAYILAGVMFIGSIFLPASPIWMYSHDFTTEEILRSLRSLYPDITESTVLGMKRACELDDKERANKLAGRLRNLHESASWLSPLMPYINPQLKVILLDRTCRRGTTVAVTINVMKILTGQTATMYYLSTIFGYIWTSSADIEFNSLMYIVSRTLVDMVMIYVINFLGRREWLMLSLFILFASQFVMYFGFMYSNSDMELMIYFTGLGFEVGLGSVAYLVQPEVVPFYVRVDFAAIGNSGCFVFMIAIFLSQVLSILLIRYYRAQADHEISLTTSNLAAYNPLMGTGTGIFDMDSSILADQSQVCIMSVIREKNRVHSVSISVLAVLFGFFVIAATFVPCYHLTYYDVLAKVNFEVTKYSLFSGFVTVGKINHVGPWNVLLAIVGMVLVVVLPVLEVVLLLVTWWFPLTLTVHKRLALVQEHIGHWSSMVAFFLAVGVVVYEIGDLLETSAMTLIVNIDVKLLPVFFFFLSVSIVFSLLRWHILHFHAEMIRSTIEGEVLGQWRKPIYRSDYDRSDSFGIADQQT